jgi:hypothetical protein
MSAEIVDPVEGQIVRVVEVVRVAPCGTRNGHDVVAVEPPINVLPGVMPPIGVLQHDRMDLPPLQVGRRDQGQHVALGGGVGLLVDQRPITGRNGIEVDREFRPAAGKVDQAPVLVVDSDCPAVGRDGQQVGPVHPGVVDPQEVDHLPAGRDDNVPLAPSAAGIARLLAHPGEVELLVVAARPAFGSEQIGVQRRRHNERAIGVRGGAAIALGPSIFPFHRPPKPTFMHHHRHTAGVVATVFEQSAGVSVDRFGPSPAAVLGSANDHVAPLFVHAHDVQRAIVDEEGRPELAVDPASLRPRLPAVDGAKHQGRTTGAVPGVRAEERMGCHVLTVGQNGDGRAAEVLARRGRTVIDHHARHIVVRGLDRRSQGSRQGQEQNGNQPGNPRAKPPIQRNVPERLNHQSEQWQPMAGRSLPEDDH